jgi:uncharacterized protein YidB (DUF937 family)
MGPRHGPSPAPLTRRTMFSSECTTNGKGHMDKMFGGSGSGPLGGLESMLGGVMSGGVSSVLPAVIDMIGGKSGGASGKGGASNGLQDVIEALQKNGLGDIVGSWVGMGPNRKVTKSQVKKGLGKDKIKHLAEQSGLPEDEVAQHLTTILPSLVNNLTPDGKVPDLASLEKSLGGLQGLFK